MRLWTVELGFESLLPSQNKAVEALSSRGKDRWFSAIRPGFESP